MIASKTMKAARVLSQGSAQFDIVDLPIPSPSPGQVLIKVESAGVNFSDVKRRRGDAYPFPTSFPFVPGSEIVGTIVDGGPGTESLSVGTRVLALAGENGFGGYAQYAIAYAPTAVPLPEGFDSDLASTTLVAGCTAQVMLTQTANLKAGEAVFIPSATGGVGSYAVQIAKALDAQLVIAGVGDLSKKQAALENGADHVVVQSDPEWYNKVLDLTDGVGVDVALEASGQSTLEETLRCLAPFGRLVVFGAASGVSATLGSDTLDRWLYAPAANQQITGFNIGGWFMAKPQETGAAMMELFGKIASGHVRSPAITTLPLSSARLAHETLEQRRSNGKIVLKPWQS